MDPLSEAVLTAHARGEMERRGISEGMIRAVLDAPDEVRPVRTGRVVAQSVVRHGPTSAKYLLRVFVDIDRSPPEIVTAYLTSRIAKYTRRA